jgi:virginiamycin B lyase
VNRVRLAILGSLLAATVVLWVPAPAGAFLYWTTNQSADLGRANLDGSGANGGFVVPGTGGPGFGVAVDAGHIYWAGHTAGTIGRADLDGTSVEPSFITGAAEPSGVAIGDGHIYWANEGSNTIGRAKLDGSAPEQSFIATGSAPDGVTIGATRIYWANGGGGTIGSAQLNTDGSIKTGVSNTFINSPSVVAGPSAIATDGSSIYWANAGDGTVAKATAEGTGAAEIVHGLSTPSGVAVDSGHLYWSSSAGAEIGRSGLDGTAPNYAFIAGLTGVDGVAVDAGALPPGTSIPISPGVTAKKLHPVPSLDWRVAAVKDGLTRFTKLKLTKVPRRAAVEVLCKGGGCPFRTVTERRAELARAPARSSRAPSKRVKKRKPSSGTRDLLAALQGKKLHAGARLTITVTEKATIGKAWVLRTANGSRQPMETVACLEPGSSALLLKCTGTE